MLDDAVKHYHELLQQDGIAEETDALLRKRLKERNLYFGDRPLCVVLRPHFYTVTDWEFIKGKLDLLLGAFQKVHEVCLTSADHRAQLHMDDYEESLIPYDKPHVAPWTSSRLDTFFVLENRELKCVEYNAETPAGIGYADTLTDVFDQLPPMQRFKERYPLRYLPSLGNLTESILSAWQAWGGTHTPQIGILDWREVPTLNEHEITRDFFERNGLKAKLADPRTLEYHDGKLWSDDFRIDLVYKRVLYSELTERMGMDNPIYQALRDGNLFITNGISAKMLAKKASLAFLSDERNTNLFTKAQHEAIRAHIPWTRVIEERTTTYNDKTVDLIDFLAENKERFVIKPNDEYGGSGVLLGWECTQQVWEAGLRKALEIPYVAQERVTVVQRDFPSWIGEELDISPRYVDADPYVFNGRSVLGCMTRLSSLSLLNVTAGGGSVVPTILIEE